MPDPARGVPRARLVDLLRRQRHLPEGGGPGRGGGARPARPPARGDRRPVPDAAGRAQGAQPARLRRAHRALRRRAPRHRLRRARGARSRPTPRSCSAGDAAEQPGAAEPAPHARVRHPARSRELGQNFLVDSNILGVIGRAAELTPDDVVLEIGGGLGVLSEYLARARRARARRRARPRLEPALRDALDPHPNTTLHLADAMKLDLRALDPPPTKVVANLPYGVAAPRSCARSRAARRHALGRDGAEGGRRALRGRARHAPPTACRRCSPSSPATCASSRPVSRTVFQPVPNVDSVLVGLERRGAGAAEPALRALVQHGVRAPPQGARAVALLAPHAAGGMRERAREALDGARPPRRRARRALSPAESRARARLVGAGCAHRAPARSTSACSWARARRRPAPARLGHAADRRWPTSSRWSPARATATRSSARASTATNLAARALREFRARRGWDGPPQRLDDRQADPGRRRHGRRLGDAAAALRLAARAAGVRRPRRSSPMRLGADVTVMLYAHGR